MDPESNTQTAGKVHVPLVLPTVLGMAALLSALSIFQKTLLGADPFVLKGFIVPVLFGSGTGFLLGRYMDKIRLLNTKLSNRVHALESLTSRVQKLESLLPICSCCHRIRVKDGDPDVAEDWHRLEQYLSEHTGAQFTHSLCPECKPKYMPEE